MTDNNYTAVMLIVDRSGSMANIKTEMEGSLRTFVEDQAKQPGKITFDYVLFDDKFDYVEKFARADEFVPTITPRGMTALHDAIGLGVTEFGESLANLTETRRPGKVLVVIATDGFENVSREFNAQSVRDLIKHQKDKYSWDFVFLGANQDAIETAAGYGIGAGSALTFNANAQSVGATSSVLSGYTTTYRGGGKAAFSEEDREVTNV